MDNCIDFYRNKKKQIKSQNPSSILIFERQRKFVNNQIPLVINSIIIPSVKVQFLQKKSNHIRKQRRLTILSPSIKIPTNICIVSQRASIHVDQSQEAQINERVV